VPSETIEAPFTLDLPGLEEIDDIRNGADIQGPWIVILYNCDCHTFQDVESILQKATGCSLEKAKSIAVEVDSKGRAICFSGEREECERVASIIASVRLQVETDRA
jgi:ATP-dependent Clp protease adaptor protein ClpS